MTPEDVKIRLERIAFWADSARSWAEMAQLWAPMGPLADRPQAEGEFQTRLIRLRGALAQAAEALRAVEKYKPAVLIDGGDDGWDL